MKKAATNLPASVRQRLLNLANEKRQDFGMLLTNYALERFLYRLSVSRHRDSFVLKGALLLQLWTSEVYRPTRDLDLLATSDRTGEGLPQSFRGRVCGESGRRRRDLPGRLCLSKTSKRLSGRELYFFPNSLLRC